MALNYSEATRRPQQTFAELCATEQFQNAEFVGDAVVTKRLIKRGIHVFAAPRTVSNGYRGTLGRINYSAAIDKRDANAMTALKEEYANR